MYSFLYPTFVNVGSQAIHMAHCFGPVVLWGPLFWTSRLMGPIVLDQPLGSLHCFVPPSLYPELSSNPIRHPYLSYLVWEDDHL